MYRPRLRQPYLVRYGHRGHIERLLNEGVMRITPASDYKSDELNEAIRDEELRKSVRRDPNTLRFKVRSKRGIQKGTIAPIDGIVEVFSKCDFYITCFSYELSARLFLDFGYDACLVIKDPDQFFAKLSDEFGKQCPRHRVIATPVRYFDPVTADLTKLRAYEWKHFRFEYQQEYRLFYVPPQSEYGKLQYREVRLGALRDIADLIRLN